MYQGEKCTPYLSAIAAAKNIPFAVICSGSRSAPLTLAFLNQNEIECIPVVDERSAGYIALGISQQTELPTILICTSGTAALNFSPSVAEAYYQKIPLLILTADRPLEWIDQLDGQAIKQQGIFEQFSLKSYHLTGEIYHEDDLWYAQRVMNEAIDIALENNGPVHINISFREPLYQLPELDSSKLKIIRSTISEIHPVNSDPILAATALAASFRKILIILGQGNWEEEEEYLLKKIQKYPNVVIVHESLCNIELENSILNVNECLVNYKSELIPELIINMGGNIVSKRLKQFLRNSNAELWNVSMDKTYTDTYKKLSRHIQCNNYTFLFSMGLGLKRTEVKSDFYHIWKTHSENIQSKTDAYFQKIPFSDMKAYHFIFNNLPETFLLQLGNSTPVRYGQIFYYLYSGINTYSNRGTSGIDGIVSTAVGACYASEQPVLVIVGDLSFQYDINALWNKQLSPELKIIVINNSGGNIFRLLEGSSQSQYLEEFFEMRIEHYFKNICEHFNVAYYKAESDEELKLNWKKFIEISDKASVLEIKTDPVLSEKVFKEFYQYLSND